MTLGKSLPWLDTIRREVGIITFIQSRVVQLRGALSTSALLPMRSLSADWYPEVLVLYLKRPREKIYRSDAL